MLILLIKNYLLLSTMTKRNATDSLESKIVLENPSYPFVFLPEVQEPLEEIGSAVEFDSLVTKANYQFHEGDSLTVEIDGKGDLKVVDKAEYRI